MICLNFPYYIGAWSLSIRQILQYKTLKLKCLWFISVWMICKRHSNIWLYNPWQSELHVSSTELMQTQSHSVRSLTNSGEGHSFVLSLYLYYVENTCEKHRLELLRVQQTRLHVFLESQLEHFAVELHNLVVPTVPKSILYAVASSYTST